MKAAVIQLARRALPLMNATHRAEAERIIAHFERTPDADEDPFSGYLRRAAAAWEKDLHGTRLALAAALHAGSSEALAGFRHLLPGLLREANESPALAGVLAEAMTHGFYTGFIQDPAAEEGRTANAAEVLLSEAPLVTESVKHWRAKEILPVDVGSAELRGLRQDIKLRSVFSARTTNADYLDEVAGVVDDILSGKTNMATGRLRLMRKLKTLGYDPETGFPGDFAMIPPAERGSLQDLSSERRIDLMLRTLVAMARNYGRVVSGNTPEARLLFPAWELVRLGVRDVPRGFRRVQGQLVPDPPEAWLRRWQAAGESVLWEGASEQAMIALKDSPIWPALGAGEGGHTDTLGNPFPPFAFNSGMDWRAVPRAECRTLGLIAGEEKSAPMQAEIAPGDAEAQRSAERLREDLRAELLRRWAEWGNAE